MRDRTPGTQPPATRRSNHGQIGSDFDASDRKTMRDRTPGTRRTTEILERNPPATRGSSLRPDWERLQSPLPGSTGRTNPTPQGRSHTATRPRGVSQLQNHPRDHRLSN
ncbi:unnamed protein product [Spirodela intermedia]|uniref:Uncharacterized protein n=1 Tax=Spirodela intermedia TaxID=51605 RepID=A0A7I8JVB4_SPIIN|nr:unnamed protein product [Spirodela intermedia]CAA6673402.1 unnamed protein product [Spirodela intermedia]